MALKPKHIPHAFRQDPDALPRKPNLQKLCLMPKAFLSPSLSSVWESNRGDDVDELAWRDRGRRAQTDQTMPTAWLSITVSIALVVVLLLLLLALVLVVVHHLSVPSVFFCAATDVEIGIQCGQLFRVLMWKRCRRVQESSRGQGPLPQVHISSGTDTDAQRNRERSVLCNCRSLLLLSSRETLSPFFFFFFFFFEHLRCREIFSVSVCYFGGFFLL